jgi:hypothetical protein
MKRIIPFTPLLDHDAVRQTLGPTASALHGRTVVNLANSAPDHARELST